MKTTKMFMAVVALFISMSVMTAQAPAKKAGNEPVKKECCDKKAAECKEVAKCQDADKKACCEKKDAKCQDPAKKAACKDTAKKECCAEKNTAKKVKK